jgi:hypothetical protein
MRPTNCWQDARPWPRSCERLFSHGSRLQDRRRSSTATALAFPLGVLNSGALITVAKEAGQPRHGAYQNLTKMAAAALGGSHPQRGLADEQRGFRPGSADDDADGASVVTVALTASSAC